MAAPECLPLILEPESRFFTDPVLVMDFQSLYPSIIIAHNYCYSTCLGKMKHIFRYFLWCYVKIFLCDWHLQLSNLCSRNYCTAHYSICELFTSCECTTLVPFTLYSCCRGEDFPFGAVSHSVPHATLKVSHSLLVIVISAIE